MIQENKDITAFTTFGIPVKAKYFAEFSSEKELQGIIKDSRFINSDFFCIGGGSNLLFIGDYDGMVLHSQIKGIKRYDKDATTVYAIVGSGENWNNFVEWTIEQELQGLENLIAIPGDVGAAPVQNVGAYGMEAGNAIFSVECYDLLFGKVVILSAEECRFGYRDSIFKNKGKGRYIVLRVSFKLSRNNTAGNLEYGPLQELHQRLGHAPTLKEVADEIKLIRHIKLPDPSVKGNVGSFFKNPIVRKGFIAEIEALTGISIPVHEIDDVHVKVSAAWLIDKAGMKGERIGGAMVSTVQPLVILNENNASAEDVTELAKRIMLAVRKKFMIHLVPEVNYIDTKVKVTILGTGTSKGIPEVGCLCRVCNSPFEKDKRTRTSAFIQTMGLNILIDPSPDFRIQCLKNDIYHIDAVLITHSHYDHVGGLDDLRPFCAKGHLPVYANAKAIEGLKKHYDYCFGDNTYPGVPKFTLIEIGLSPFFIKGVKVIPIEVMHGPMPILGYRIGNFTYITDAKTIDDSQLQKIIGTDVLVINALRFRDHFSHFTLEEALRIIDEISPRRAFLTHFNHEIGRHDELDAGLPLNVSPAYDGQSFTVK